MESIVFEPILERAERAERQNGRNSRNPSCFSRFLNFSLVNSFHRALFMADNFLILFEAKHN